MVDAKEKIKKHLEKVFQLTKETFQKETCSTCYRKHECTQSHLDIEVANLMLVDVLDFLAFKIGQHMPVRVAFMTLRQMSEDWYTNAVKRLDSIKRLNNEEDLYG